MPSVQRGEVWLVDLEMAAKVRPCLIISIPALDEDRALATIIPHTTATRGSRFEVTIQAHYLRKGAFDIQGIRSVPHAKFIRLLGSLTPDQMREIETTLRVWLSLQL